MGKQVARAGDIVNGQKLLPGSGAPGPGRPKGSKDKSPRTLQVNKQKTRDIVSRILTEGPTPLELMWGMMKGTRKFNLNKFLAAKAAAPYVHPKLQAIELSGRLGVSHEDALERLARMEATGEVEEPEDVPFEILEDTEEEDDEDAEEE